MPEADNQEAGARVEPTLSGGGPGLPVFVGGLERSGTSLVRAMLGSSPDLAMFERDWLLLSRYASTYGPNLSGSSSADLQVLAARVFLDKKALESAALRPMIGDLAARTVAGEFATYADLARTTLEEFRIARDRPRVGLKRPYLEFYLDNLDSIFGDYYFVHLIRNPFDSFRSAVAYGMRAVPEVWGRRWRQSVEIGEARSRDRHLVVRYEDVAGDRGAWSVKLAEFCNLTWADAMVTGENHPEWTGSNSSFGAGRSSTPLAPEVAARVAAGAGEALARWGYDGPQASTTQHLLASARIAAEGAREQVSAGKAKLRRAVATRSLPA